VYHSVTVTVCVLGLLQMLLPLVSSHQVLTLAAQREMSALGATPGEPGCEFLGIPGSESSGSRCCLSPWLWKHWPCSC